jgi:hypothetical protein
MKKTTIYCDLCGEEKTNIISLEIPTEFINTGIEGNDGYWEKHRIDICKECMVDLIKEMKVVKTICNKSIQK